MSNGSPCDDIAHCIDKDPFATVRTDIKAQEKRIVLLS
jgi:hypothetical protein